MLNFKKFSNIILIKIIQQGKGVLFSSGVATGKLSSTVNPHHVYESHPN